MFLGLLVISRDRRLLIVIYPFAKNLSNPEDLVKCGYAGKTYCLYRGERVRALSGRQSCSANQLFGRMADIGDRRFLHRFAEFDGRADFKNPLHPPARLDFKSI